MEWYYAQQGRQVGPVELGVLQEELGKGGLARTDLVWRPGMEQWTPAGEVSELTPAGEGAPVPSGGTAPVITAPPPSSAMATASLVCGMASLLLCAAGVVAAVPAVVCGHLALKQIREAPVPMTGRGMALGGLITGYLVLAFQLFSAAGLLIMLVMPGG